MVILPLFAFAITALIQWIMLLLSSPVLLGNGAKVPRRFGTRGRCWERALVLLYHFVTVHRLWYAPMYGWLLLVSAGGRRRAIPVGQLAALCDLGVEKMAFNTTYFLSLLKVRLTGPPDPDMPRNADLMSTLIPHHFF